MHSLKDNIPDTGDGDPLIGQKGNEKVIILGARFVAIGIIRAFSRSGIPIVLLYLEKDDPAYQSRFLSQRVHIPHPLDNRYDLLKILMESVKDWEGSLLIPSQDEYVVFIAQNRAELKNKYVFSVQDWETTRGLITKSILYGHAQASGVPTPRVYFPDSEKYLADHRRDFSYPCILKPSETHKFNQVYKKKVLIAQDYQDLLEKYNDARVNGLDVMISEIVPGDDSTLFTYRSYIDSKGEILAEMCSQKLRQYPSGFGQGSLVRTIPMVDEIRDHALRILRRISYQGQSAAEFRWDRRDNQYKLMEINVRPVLTEMLFVKAGMNFPYMTYLDFVKNVRKKTSTYTKDLHWIHNYWEFIYLLKALRSKGLSLREFLRPYSKKKVFFMPFLIDPFHYLTVCYLNLRKLLRQNIKKV